MSADVPGQAPKFEELVAITLEIVPELLVANGVLSSDHASEVALKVMAERREIARLEA